MPRRWRVMREGPATLARSSMLRLLHERTSIASRIRWSRSVPSTVTGYTTVRHRCIRLVAYRHARARSLYRECRDPPVRDRHPNVRRSTHDERCRPRSSQRIAEGTHVRGSAAANLPCLLRRKIGVRESKTTCSRRPRADLRIPETLAGGPGRVAPASRRTAATPPGVPGLGSRGR